MCTRKYDDAESYTAAEPRLEAPSFYLLAENLFVKNKETTEVNICQIQKSIVSLGDTSRNMFQTNETG